MEKAVGIGLFALLVVGVAFVQVHYYSRTFKIGRAHV